MTTRRAVVPLLLVVLWGVLCLHSVHFRYMSDDSYISFRYAANWVDGTGLVFNAGERVQGYSNFLWVVLLAALHGAGLDLPWAARVLGALFAAGVLCLSFLLVRQRKSPVIFALIAPLLLCAHGSFAFWVFGGLENQLFSFLLLLSLLLLAREQEDTTRRPYSTIPFAALALTRPEGVFYFVALHGVVLLRKRFSRRSLLRAAQSALVFIAMVAPYKVWQFVYYGDVVSNPYYTKSHPLSAALLLRGLSAIHYFLIHYSLLVHAVVLVAGLMVLVKGPSADLVFTALVSCLIFYLAVGGDAQPYFRLLVWMHPLVAILLAWLLQAAYERLRHATEDAPLWRRYFAPAVVCASLAAVTALWAVPSVRSAEHTNIVRDRENLRGWRLIGEWLRQNAPPSTLVAVNNVGIMPYYSGLPTLDMLGLVDRHIARDGQNAGVGVPGHERFDADYVLARRPDIIVPGMGTLTSRPSASYEGGFYVSDAALFVRPRFAAEYIFRSVPIAPGAHFNHFVRRTKVGAGP